MCGYCSYKRNVGQYHNLNGRAVTNLVVCCVSMLAEMRNLGKLYVYSIVCRG